jgi:hypothetical protein
MLIIASNIVYNFDNERNTRLDYQARNSILLEPGFKAENGMIFTAQIGGCFILEIEVLPR